MLNRYSNIGLSAFFVAACFFILGAIPPACKAADPPLMFIGDFEKRGIHPFDDTQLEFTLNKSEIVTSPVRCGKHALKVTLDRTKHEDMMGHRTDFWIKGMSKKFNMQEEYWYGFSTYWPESWQPDTQSELFVQWIGWRTHGPALAIYVSGDNYCIRKRWGGNKCYKNLWRGMVAPDRGLWVDWVFHVRWSTDKDGVVEVWKNGEKIVVDAGRNCDHGEFAPYFKFGIYKWPWKESQEKTPSTVTSRTIYFDEIRIGDKSANYDLVSPPGAAQIHEH